MLTADASEGRKRQYISEDGDGRWVCRLHRQSGEDPTAGQNKNKSEPDIKL